MLLKTVLDFLKLIRATNLCLIALGLSFFYYFILVPVHKHKIFTTLLPFSDFDFMLFVFSVLLVASAGNIISSYFDFESDKEFKPESPLARGTFSLDSAMYMHALFAFAGIGIGFYLGYTSNNFKIGYIYIVCVVLLYVRSAFLKKIPLAGNIVAAALAGFTLVLLLLFESVFLNTISFEGANYVLGILLLQMKIYGGFIFLVSLVCEIAKDISHLEADKKYNVNTLAVQFGAVIAKGVAVLTLGLLLAGLICLIRDFVTARAVKEFSYLITGIALPLSAVVILLLLAREEKQYNRILIFLKAIMLIGILSIPAFYFFNK